MFVKFEVCCSGRSLTTTLPNFLQNKSLKFKKKLSKRFFFLIFKVTFLTNLSQMELVSDCASRLRLMSAALDVSHVGQVSSSGLLRLQKVTFNLDMKEGLLEAWALLLLANNQTDPQTTGEPTYVISLQCLGFLLTVLRV